MFVWINACHCLIGTRHPFDKWDSALSVSDLANLDEAVVPKHFFTEIHFFK